MLFEFLFKEGNYALETLSPGPSEPTFTARDYLPHVENVELEEGEPVYATDGLLVVRLEDTPIEPSGFGIVSACSNPFNARARLTYRLPEASRVKLAGFDLSGRLVQRLVSGERAAGVYEVTLDSVGLASAVYLVRLEASGGVARFKVVLMR